MTSTSNYVRTRTSDGSSDDRSENLNQIVVNSNDKEKMRETYFTEQIEIPDTEDRSFSFRKLWMFTGPGFLMSIAFLDPGNIESDMQAGTIARYKLLWVLVWSTILGLLMQRLSARLGTVTGLHLAELCYKRYPAIPRLLIWIMIEIAIIGSDMQEVIGTSIAIYMLSSRKILIWQGVLITIFDTFTFLFLDKYGLRRLELFFSFLIAVMAATFGYEYFVVKPESLDVAKGIVVPWCKDCSTDDIKQAVGIVGAIIMPHNLYLHSALVKSRRIDRSNKAVVKEANKYVFIESAVALGISLLINIAVTAVFAHGLHGKTNEVFLDECKPNAPPSILPEIIKHFPNNTEQIETDLYKAGLFLGCSFGLSALYIWAIGIFAAGQSSTMTGTVSGQFCMEGFLNIYWVKWKRVLLTRTIAIAPTLFLSFSADLDKITSVNDSLNALMSLMLPFALLPVLTFTSSERVMGSFKNGFINKLIATILSFAVISINLYFVYNFAFVEKNIPVNIYTSILILIFVIYYIIFILYLLGCFLVVIGVEFITRIPKIGRYFVESEEQEHTVCRSTKTSLVDSINNPNYRTGQEERFNQIIED